MREVRYPTRFDAQVQSAGGWSLNQIFGVAPLTQVVVTPSDFVTREVGVSMNATAIAGPTLGSGVQLATQKSKWMDDTTDLMLAATAGEVAKTRQLIAAGANVNVTNRHGSTALMGAAAGGFPEVVQLLLDNKANVQARSRNGMTPVLAAARNGHAQVMSMLLENGAPVDAVDNEGQTALMYAVKNGYTDVATVMVEHGADMNRKDGAGKTPVQVASDLKNKELVILLTRPAKANGPQRLKAPATAGKAYR